MTQFGELNGSGLIPLLSTLITEGKLEQVGTLYTLKAQKPDGTLQAEIHIMQERIVKAHLSNFKLQIGKMLVKKGWIERKDYEDLKEKRSTMPSPKPTFSQLLLNSNLVTEAQLTQIMEEVIEIVFYDVLMWDRVEINISQKELEDLEPLLGIDLNVFAFKSLEDLLMEAEKNQPILALMHTKMNNPHAVLRHAEDIDINLLSEPQLAIFQYMNQRNTLRDIVFLSHLNIFETHAALFQLLGDKLISFGQAPPPSQYRSKTPSKQQVQTPKTQEKQAVQQRKDIQAPSRREFLKRTYGSELQQILLGLVKSGRKTGKLIIDNQKNIARSELTLYKGELVHASSSIMTYRFGDLLLMKGLIKDGDLRPAIKEQKASPGQHLGEILLGKNLISREIIPQIVYEQIEFILYEILSWDDAKFYFQPTNNIPQSEYVVYTLFDGDEPLSIKHKGEYLLREAEKNISLLNMMKDTLPLPKAIITKTQLSHSESLSSEQIHILDLINDSYALQDILVVSKLGYFETYTGLFQLFRANLIQELILDDAPSPTDFETKDILQEPKAEVLYSPIQAGQIIEKAEQSTVPSDDIPAGQILESILGLDLSQKLIDLPIKKHQSLRHLLRSMLDLID